ncbi:MAG: GTPase HflX, partial [Bdellovibrionales bacterium]|nr:GTPase HflX [Bdellovibrionales bacterium]
MKTMVFGNTQGLAQSNIRTLEKLSRRKIPKRDIVTLEFARELCSQARTLGRQVGVLIDRQGRILHILIGSKERLYLPDLGRFRFGQGRLRTLRLVFVDLSENDAPPSFPEDIYTDLEKLRLDMVVAVKVIKNRLSMAYAHVLPPTLKSKGSERNIQQEFIRDIGGFSFDFHDFILDLERQLVPTESQEVHGKPKALLVGVYQISAGDAQDSINELKELARTAGVRVADVIVQRRKPDPRTLLGKGKLEEIVLHCLRVGADMLIFDTELRPSQWRIITNSTELKVLDRSMLILDIFAQHARSADGRLQVELAQLRYNLPRLVEKDAGLSRLTGGIGGRGPGETKLEISRRRIRDRIGFLEKRIEKLSKQRQLRRRPRQEQGIPVVAVLGYTNVGKSTLFNALTASSVVAENKLFATLDAAHRRLRFPHRDNSFLDRNDSVILTDTVGFIRELPKELTNAFRAT